MMGCDDERLAPGAIVAWSDISSVSALLQELLYHAKRNAVASRDLVARAVGIVVRSDDSFAQVQRKSSHNQTVYPSEPQWLHFYLKCSRAWQ